MMAFTQGREESYPLQATVSLSETSLQNGPVPATPESMYIKDEEDEEGEEEKKPTKKRKSWGQELPTPKTNLPPRYALCNVVVHHPSHANNDISKRAKTDDEKEQRRIERVLRNRQAAQSSRERKRQEVEKLEGEKSAIERQNESLKERLMAVEHEKFLLAQKVAKMTAQMKVFRQESGASSPEPSSPALEQFDHQRIKKEIDNEYSFVPTPELSYSGASFASPSTMTYSPSQSPPNVGLGVDDSPLTTSPDMTQHPAAMLCDLQCQSAEPSCQVSSTQPTTRATPLPIATPLSSAQLVSLMVISAVYSQLMVPLEMIFVSLKTGLPVAIPSTTVLTSRTTSPSAAMLLPLIRWLISTPASLTPTPPMTLTTSKPTTIATTTSTATCSRTLVLRPRMLRRLLLSSPSLARPLRAATGRTLRLKTSKLTGSTDGARRIGRHQGLPRSRNGKAGLSNRSGVLQRSRQGEVSRSVSSIVRAQTKVMQRRAMSAYSKSR